MKKLFWLISVVLIFTMCNKKNESSYYKIEGNQFREGSDPYKTNLYWSLNNSQMQGKIRSIKPFPVGVVYYQQRGDNMDSVKKEFKVLKDLGFTSLKQVVLSAPDNAPDFEKQVFYAALDAGITPWYYGAGGWDRISQRLVDSLGIKLAVNTKNLPVIESDERMLKYQDALLRSRIERMHMKPIPGKGKGEPGRNNAFMPERLIPEFAKWLEKQYLTIDALKVAWNCGFCGKCEFSNFSEAAKLLEGQGFDEFGKGTGKVDHDFRRYRDAMRFQADLIVENYQGMMKMFNDWDSLEPERTGGHQLFENQAMNTWDLEGQAKSARIGGSFYSSIHLAHHFFLIDGEMVRPAYFQARTIADMFKGGWAATWESTGGPTQWSGYDQYTVDEGRMTQLMLSYLAAGLKGVGLWMWNSRGEGWEVGEYALADNQGKPSPRAITVGNISKKIQEQRFELWDALDEPTVGILYSWENEAMLGRLSMGSYPLNTAVFTTMWDKQFRQYHSQAKIGISRTLVDNNVPFEYVTERDLTAGLIDRYPIIYLPFVVALDEAAIDTLMSFVERGGRLVADCPVLMIDTYGRLNKQRVGSKFEKLFGFQAADYYNTFNATKIIDNIPITGQFADVKITHGTITAKFHDGSPAIISSNYGKGTTTVFNFEASRNVFKQGNMKMEKLINYYTLGSVRPQYSVKQDGHSFVLRRSAPNADHYFIINPCANGKVIVSSSVLNYTKAQDVLNTKDLSISGNSFTVSVPARSGVWVRVEKKKLK